MTSVAGLLLAAWQGTAAADDVVFPTQEEIAKMRQAAPAEAPAKPAKPRRLLVWGHVAAHLPVPFASKALEILGEKSGAFRAVVSDDPDVLLPDKLSQFDGLVMNNIHEQDPFLPRGFEQLPEAERKKVEARVAAIQGSILDFVSGGKGIVGIHAATAALQRWPEYGELMGGYYASHLTDEVPIKVDDPDHPINACFRGQGFRIHDEIYFLSEQNPRGKYRVLLSLDLGRMADPGARPDRDYAVSLVRQYGKGRVFYCTLGHFPETYWNPLFLEHLLAGIQFAVGDLKADASPRPL